MLGYETVLIAGDFLCFRFVLPLSLYWSLLLLA